jgi:hypothetical protein
LKLELGDFLDIFFDGGGKPPVKTFTRRVMMMFSATILDANETGFHFGNCAGYHIALEAGFMLAFVVHFTCLCFRLA